MGTFASECIGNSVDKAYTHARAVWKVILHIYLVLVGKVDAHIVAAEEGNKPKSY